ncbi:hypothetical protein, partial [Desulfovulcanus sp.]
MTIALFAEDEGLSRVNSSTNVLGNNSNALAAPSHLGALCRQLPGVNALGISARLQTPFALYKGNFLVAGNDLAIAKKGVCSGRYDLSSSKSNIVASALPWNELTGGLLLAQNTLDEQDADIFTNAIDIQITELPDQEYPFTRIYFNSNVLSPLNEFEAEFEAEDFRDQIEPLLGQATISLAIAGETYAFLIETLTRNDDTYTIWGRNKAVAKVHSPWAVQENLTLDSDTWASDLLVYLFSDFNVAFESTDFMIPAGWSFCGTKLEILQEIVSQFYGIFYFSFDGTTLYIKNRFPVRPCELSSTQANQLSDDDLISISEDWVVNEPVEKPFSQGLFFQILTFFVLDGSSCRHQHFILLQLIHKSS